MCNCCVLIGILLCLRYVFARFIGILLCSLDEGDIRSMFGGFHSSIDVKSVAPRLPELLC